MSRINSKNKGNRNERQVAEFLKKWSGLEFSRVPSSGGLRWKGREDTIGDITCTNGDFPFSVEAKFYRELNFEHLLYLDNAKIYQFWQQASNDALRANKEPLLFMRYNGLPKGFYFILVSNSFYRKVIVKAQNQVGVKFNLFRITFKDNPYYILTSDTLIQNLNYDVVASLLKQ